MVTFMQDAIDELYRCFGIINKEKFNDSLPEPIITIQKTPKALGHCSVHKVWADCRKEKLEEDNEFYEVNIASNYMNKGTSQIVEVLLHEACHLYNVAVVGKKDCNGKKHNKRFYKVATEMAGLVIKENDAKVGYGYTELSEETEKWIQEVVQPDESKFKYFYYIAPKPVEEKPVQKKFNINLYCPTCGLEIKLEEDFEQYNFYPDCPCCNTPFENKPKGKRGRKAKEN